MESTTILGAIFGLVALMLVFFLYINRKWCFNSTPGFPCCDETSLPSKYVHKMGKCVIAQNEKLFYSSVRDAFASRHSTTYYVPYQEVTAQRSKFSEIRLLLRTYDARAGIRVLADQELLCIPSLRIIIKMIKLYFKWQQFAIIFSIFRWGKFHSPFHMPFVCSHRTTLATQLYCNVKCGFCVQRI